ncbi:MAG: folate-binding protein [Candidatus Korobacteraceae bacterium]
MASSGAQFGLYAGAQTPSAFSGARAEFAALRQGCGILDVNWRAKLVVSGEDRVRWLNGMVTNNTRDLALNQGNYSFILNAQGRIQGDLVAYNRGEFYLVATDVGQSARIREFFDRYIIMDDVEVTDISEKLATLAVVGPNSRDVLATAGMTLPEMEPYQIHDFVWSGMGLTAARFAPAMTGFELWMHPDNAALVWESLIQAGAVPAGTRAWEWLRISLGIPLYGVDIGERELPQETGRQDALHFSKGCYIGQEIVERIRSRGNVHRVFVGFRLQAESPANTAVASDKATALAAVGDKVQLDGKDVGEITSAASMPAGGSDVTLALGYIRREAAASAGELQIGSGIGKIEPLPFVF